MPRSRSKSRTTIEARTDTDLATRAGGGDTDAFEELYRRHAQAAWRVAYAVAGNRDDAADAVSDAFARVLATLPTGPLATGEAPFRPYVLAATRNAAIDTLRRKGRLEPTEDMADFETMGAPAPADQVLEQVDVNLVAIAFSGLPERWRSVLWLTEVEGLPPRDAAPLLGLSANGAAQLAVRARAGLRERYLQAHVAATVPAECQFTTEHLGAYVGGALSPRDVAKVDQHLAGCRDCEQRRQELEDVGTTLRRILLPLPLGVGTTAVAKWATGFQAAHEGVRRSSYLAAVGTDGLSRLHRPLMAAAGLTFALGIIGATVIDDSPSPRLPSSGRDRGTAIQPRRPAVVEGIFASAPGAPSTPGAGSAVAGRDELALATPPVRGGSPASPSPSPAPNAGTPTSGGGSAGAPAEPTPIITVSAKTAPGPIGAAVGDSCNGLLIADTLVGCPPPAEAGALLGVKTEGELSQATIRF